MNKIDPVHRTDGYTGSVTVQCHLWLDTQQAQDFPASAEHKREEKPMLGWGVSYSGDKVGEPWRVLQLSCLTRRLDNGQGGAWAWRLWGLGRDAAPTGTTKGWSCLVVLVGLTLKTHSRLTSVLISNRILSAFNVSSMWIVSVKSSVIWSVWTLQEPGQCHPGFGGNISFCWDHNKPSPLTALKGGLHSACRHSHLFEWLPTTSLRNFYWIVVVRYFFHGWLLLTLSGIRWIF